MANEPPEHDPRYDWLYESPRSGDRPGGRAGDRRHRAAQPPPPPPAPPHDQNQYDRDPYDQNQYDPGTRVMPTNQARQGDPAGPPPPRQQRSAPAGPPPAAPRRAGGRRRFPIVRTILLVLLAYVIFMVAVPVLSWNRVDKVDAMPDGDRPADARGTNYLLVGSDSREGLTPEQRNELGTGNAGGQRTDSIMLLHVPGGFGPPVLISFPRDSYVEIPGHGESKINSAFSWGGPKLLAASIEAETGVRVDEYIEIGFGGFVDVVEAVDGVEMCLPDAIQDDDAHIDLPAGCQMLDGADALGYVRMRKADPRGDLGRVERQQEFLSAVMKRVLTPGTLLNPVRYWGFGMSTGDALTADEGTGVFDMARFFLAMRAISSGAGVAMTVPTAGTDNNEAGSVVLIDDEAADALFRALNSGEEIPTELIPKEGEDDQ